MLLATCCVVTFLVAVCDYGKHTWDFRPRNIDEFALFAQIRATLVITATVWTKTAFAVTLLRFTNGWIKKFIWIIIFSMNLAMAVSASMTWLRCRPLPRAWTPSLAGTCDDLRILTGYNMFSGGKLSRT
jgi:hypothetical protein